ncbi:MAG: glycosyltransferase family 2 protein [Anaerolineae bacterium]|nr:glycosyltransferase family 2 protein [Anaerolineae bacterium]
MPSICVSVIVLSYNSADDLPICIESLHAQTYTELELIVADNASQDDSASICAQYDDVKWLPLGANHGFGKGNNLAAAEAKGDYLLFVNPDMRFAPDMIEQLVQVAESIPSLFALDCKQYDWNKNLIIHGATYMCSGSIGSAFQPYLHLTQLDVDSVVPIPCANGATYFCRRDRFESLGGFDPTFFLEFEDLDLGWRAWMQGWSSWYVPFATCCHKVGASRPMNADQNWTSWQEISYRSANHNRFRFTMKVMNIQRNMKMLVWALRSIRSWLMQGHPRRAYTLFLAYLLALYELPDIMKARRGLSERNGEISEQLIRKFLDDYKSAPNAPTIPAPISQSDVSAP